MQTLHWALSSPNHVSLVFSTGSSDLKVTVQIPGCVHNLGSSQCRRLGVLLRSVRGRFKISSSEQCLMCSLRQAPVKLLPSKEDALKASLVTSTKAKKSFLPVPCLLGSQVPRYVPCAAVRLRGFVQKCSSVVRIHSPWNLESIGDWMHCCWSGGGRQDGTGGCGRNVALHQEQRENVFPRAVNARVCDNEKEMPLSN